jgi:pyruvate-ferredoxin/flavodoxin oxidoreductase
MIIANATGCSSIWGASAPSMPYCKDENGRGPAWANSLFEDNAEYGYGMLLATKQIRTGLQDTMEELLEADVPKSFKTAMNDWIDGKDQGDGTRDRGEKLLKEAKAAEAKDPAIKKLISKIVDQQDYLAKPSVWAVGGDGWAYDIGYGGLDHVLASGENINVLVFDTEVYSNTGGQASKATPKAAVAKFAASGKKIKKKDLGMLAMTYGYIYVAQVGMGADKNQLMKAIIEAEKYDGPSLIIAYCPCINHGIKAGMGKAQADIQSAVDSGYWHLYRYNPDLKNEGKNPFILDSKEPTKSFRDHILGHNRYAILAKEFPDIAEELYSQSENTARETYDTYRKLSEDDRFFRHDKKKTEEDKD